MKTVSANLIKSEIEKLIAFCICNIENSVCRRLEKAKEIEDNPLACFSLNQIIENNQMAKASNSPACQDTGLACFFIKLGQKVFVDGDLNLAISDAVKNAYEKNYFRKSVADPLTRVNTNDNTPPFIHFEIDNSDKIEITFLAKGAGSENMSAAHMLNPTAGTEGIIKAVVNTVISAGSNPCPPVIVGVGIGGTFDKSANLAKLALIRETGLPSTDEKIAKLECELLKKINETGIGVQGLGGKNTALAVHIETMPTHIGMLPISVNIQCHSVRRGKIIF